MLACLILYKYAKNIFDKRNQETLKQQQLLLEQKQNDEAILAQQEAEKLMQEKNYNVLSDDIDNMSIDFSADNISKRSITESLSSHKLESFLGETN